MHPPSSREPAAPPLLRLDGVVVERGERPLFAPVDLVLAPGDAVWLRGANGQGKTTLLRTLAGFAAPAAGTVARTAPLAFLGHGNALKDDLTATEALAFLASLGARTAGDADGDSDSGSDGHGDGADRRGTADARAAVLDAALERLGLPRRQRQAPVRTLSQGQRRRVALARFALPSAPPLWLLDEPFDALDADGIERVAALVAAHAAGGGAVLLTSHVPVALGGREPRTLALAAPVRPAVRHAGAVS